MTVPLDVAWQQRNPHYAVSYSVFLLSQKIDNSINKAFNYMATMAIMEYHTIYIVIKVRVGVKISHIETQLCRSKFIISYIEVSSKVAKRFYLAKARHLIQQLSSVGKYEDQTFKYVIMHKFCPTYFTEKKKRYVPFTASLLHWILF